MGRTGPNISISKSLQSEGGLIITVGDKYFGFYGEILPPINIFVSLPFLASSTNFSKYLA